MIIQKKVKIESNSPISAKYLNKIIINYTASMKDFS